MNEESTDLRAKSQDPITKIRDLINSPHTNLSYLLNYLGENVGRFVTSIKSVVMTKNSSILNDTKKEEFEMDDR